MPCELVQLEPQSAAVVRGRVRFDELPSFFGRAFGTIMAELAVQEIAIAGEPFGFYPSQPTDVVEVAAGFPVSRPIEPAGDVVPMVLPGGPVVVSLHVGPYETMEQTYHAVMEWMTEHGLAPGDQMWEYYLSDPATEPDPATWRTKVVWTVRTGRDHD